MSFLDIASFTMGILGGGFLAAMPKMNDPRPSITRLFGLGTAIAALLVFLAMEAIGDHFMPVAVGSIVLGAAAFFVLKPAFETAKLSTKLEPAAELKSVRTEQKSAA